MKCKQCGTDVKERFCCNCGAEAEAEAGAISDEDQFAEQEAEQASEQEPALQTEEGAANPKEVLASEAASSNDANSTEETVCHEEDLTNTSKGSHLVTGFSIAAVISTVMTLGFAFVHNWLMGRGQFAEELVYHIMKNFVHIPVEQAAYFSGHLSKSLWVQLQLLQGGAFHGYYTAYNGLEIKEVLSFQLHMPLVYNTIAGLLIIYIVVRLLRTTMNRSIKSSLQRLLWLIGFSSVYALMMTAITLFLNPELQFVFGAQQYTLEMEIVLWKQALTVFIGGLLASAVGLGGWKLFTDDIWRFWIKGVRTFMLLIMIFTLLIASLMAVNWSIANQNKLHSTEIITLGAVWDSYKKEPALYAIIPNVLLQEIVYSTGGTWNVSGQASAEILGMKGPIRLNMWTGIEGKLEHGEQAGLVQRNSLNMLNEEHLAKLEQDLRFNWYHFAFILIFVYALTRIRFTSLTNYLATIIGIILVSTLIAVHFNIKVMYGEETTTFIGFQPLQVLLAISILVVISLTASYGIQKYWTTRRGKHAQS